MQEYRVDPATGRIAVRTIFADNPTYVNHAYSMADPRDAPGFRSESETEMWIDVSQVIADAIAAAVTYARAAMADAPADEVIDAEIVSEAIDPAKRL